ncbi:MAG: Hsp70 family protein [Gammaproteobacteria bacterium]|nr:Hsp70 family protein [Gammaproteobacteria bacterium]
MNRVTIDFGIDLGTTNSTIALLKGMEVEVFKNNEGFEYTPSAVWIDKKNGLYVGRRAKERLEDDSENAFCEFKLQMGTDLECMFARSGRRMKSEELSAEVLKALKADVKQRTGEDVQAAAITVPAAFELPQCEATSRAASLAGISLSPLLQEPVAAALAYGFQSESDKVFWLIYDFGGGTFDAAVMQVCDGVIQAVNHGGDNHLGGKLIDWEIVEQLLIPAVTKEYRLTDFCRKNPKWNGAIAKLKNHAEQAKIRVSRDESAEIIIDFLCQDDHGEAVRFEYDLKKKDVEKLAEPFILRSINICKKILTEKRLGVGDIEKILLVGGPTLTPYLRERLIDRSEGLGIPLEFSIDPLTVVARGAAIFAGTQRIEGITLPPVKAGQYAIELEYKPMGADTEPLVGGRVLASKGENLSGFTIEFVNAEAHPAWRSGKLGLAPDGVFMANLWAEKGRLNTFLIELCDATGTRCETEPDRFSYTIGLAITDPPLTHSVGVALANNEMVWFIEKGTPLSARKREVLKSAVEVHQGQTGDVIRIPVMEGQNLRADRNRKIGNIEIKAHQVKRNVPVGSEVEVTIEIDQSRLVRVKAYIPILDEEYEDVMKIDYESPDPENLKKEADREKMRLEEYRKKVNETGDTRAQQILQQRIDGERMVHDVDISLATSQADRDAADRCKNRLLDLKIALDEVEDALEWPALVAEAEKLILTVQDTVREHGDTNDRDNFRKDEAEVRKAIQTHDVDLLRQRVEELRGLLLRILDQKGILQIIWFQQLCDERSKMRNQTQAEQLIAQGQRAINNNDYAGLTAVNRQLSALLPTPPPPPDASSLMR